MNYCLLKHLGIIRSLLKPKLQFYFLRIDTSTPWKRLKIKGLEQYQYFHLAKWLQVPIIKERHCLEYHGNSKYRCAGMSVGVVISPCDIDLKDKGHIIVRKILKRQRPNSHESPFNIVAAVDLHNEFHANWKIICK